MEAKKALVPRSAELLWVFGVVFVAFGVAICGKADLGVSMIAAPAFVVYEAVADLSGIFSVGMMEYIIQGILLILLCIVVRRFDWRYLLTFAVAVIYGCTLDLFIFLLRGITFDTVAMRWIMLIVGDTVTAFGVACFFGTYLPLQVYELFVSEFSRVYRKKITIVKWSFDASLLIISVVLAFTIFGDAGSFDWSQIYRTSFHNLGLGTLVTVLINSPIIALMSRMISHLFTPDAAFPRLEGLLSVKLGDRK